MTTRKAALAAIAVLAGLAAIGIVLFGGSSPKPLTVHGSMTIDESCDSAVSDYPDISDGAQVVITDPSGKVVATSALRQGKALSPGGFPLCNYPFTAAVAAGQPRYGITIGQGRGTVWFAAARMTREPELVLSAPASP